MARTLPRGMHFKHGAYYLVRQNKWTHIGRNLHDALVEYARLTAGQGSGNSFADVVDRTMSDLHGTISAHTFRCYEIAARRIKDAFVEFSPEQIRPHHIAQFLDAHKGTPGMANTMRNVLSNVFKRAVRWGSVESNPVRDIAPFKTPKRDRYITADEYRRIHTSATPLLACLMDMSYLTGQRIGDCIKVRYADITDSGIFFRQQKTGAKVLVTMTADLADVVRRARDLHKSLKGLTLFHRHDGTPIQYPMINRQWETACKKAGVEDAHFHDIRAAAATDAKASGLDSKTLLGHTTESSHKRYLRSRETPVATPNKARS